MVIESFQTGEYVRIEVSKINFQSEEDGWAVLQVSDLETLKPLCLVGHFAQINVGESYQAWGKWRNHNRFGRQFVAEKIKHIMPSSDESMVRYLSSALFSGIGKKTAQMIVDRFGQETLNILDHEPNKLKSIPSLGQKRITKVLSIWTRQRSLSRTNLFLFDLGLQAKSAQKIIDIYGDRTIAEISSNPYCLMDEVRGIGFLKADKMAQSLGIRKDAPERVQKAIIYLLKKSSESGDTYLYEATLLEKLGDLLQLEEQSNVENIFPKNVSILCDQGSIIVCEDVEKSSCYYLQDLFLAETFVATKIKQLIDSKDKISLKEECLLRERVNIWLDKYCKLANFSLSEEQRLALLQACCEKVFILTGGPGVGKTTASSVLIKLFKAMGKTIVLAAPTGRAAQRIQLLSSTPAQTIHRLLEWSPSEGRFLRDEDNPIAADYIIIDESSMIDIRLMASLMKAVAFRSSIIFIGDSDQLPSVGPGNVLADLIASEVIPHVRLITVFRQKEMSEIIKNAHLINTGLVPDFSQEKGADCRWINASKVKDILTSLKYLVNESLPQAGYNPLKDVQILTPMNRGDLGCHKLNVFFQDILNDKKTSSKPVKNSLYEFRPGDKVIQLVNNYDLNVFNGDIGFIERINVDGGKTQVRFADRLIAYDNDQVYELGLAYAISIHKSQGSEFPVVIIVLNMQHFLLLQKNLIYTALTRAKKLAIFISDGRTLSCAVSSQSSDNRNSLLKESLKGTIKF